MTDTKADTLLPCPFCGPGQSMVDPWFDDVSKRWAIGCGRCGASSGRSVHAEGSREAAIKSWNTRGLAAPQPVAPLGGRDAIAEKVQRILDEYSDEGIISPIGASYAIADAILAAIAQERGVDRAAIIEALRHAEVRFRCLSDEFEKSGDDTSWAMCCVDADRMGKAINALAGKETGR